MYTNRKAITIFNEDSSITLLKPFSGEYHNMVFVITEDAYGEISGELKRIVDLKISHSLTNDEYDEIISQL